MRGVRVEVSAAVGSQHLDRELRCQRTLLDRLRSRLPGFAPSRRRFEVLNRSLPDEEQRRHDRNRKQDVKRAARHIDPEISDRLRGVPRKSANQRDRNRNTHRSGNKVLDRERGHLHEVAHRRVRRIRLPVRVRHEADGRVERQIRRHRRGIPRRLRRREMHADSTAAIPAVAAARTRNRKQKMLNEISDAE